MTKNENITPVNIHASSNRLIKLANAFQSKVEYLDKADLRDATVMADLRAIDSTAESVANQVLALVLAADYANGLPNLHKNAKLLADWIDLAIKGEAIFFYADGTLPQASRLAASLHRLVDDTALESSYGSSYMRGSLIGALFIGAPGVVAKAAGRIRDALLGRASAKMTHEEVLAYREFVTATDALPGAVLITERYVFARISDGVYAFNLNKARKILLQEEPFIALNAEALVKTMSQASGPVRKRDLSTALSRDPRVAALALPDTSRER
jgi:hypothetical protein